MKEQQQAPLDDAELEKLHEEFQANYPLYAEHCLFIQTMEGELVNLEINEIQIIIERITEHIASQGRLVRLVILKARREGVSTYFCGKFFWKTTNNFNRYAMIISHEPEATDFLFNICKRFQANCPDYFRPDERYNNKKILEFNTDNGTGLDSAIRVGTAGKEDFGSAQLIHYLLLSELAKYPKHIEKPLLTSLLQCVPDHKDTMVVIESTARGIGGEFYDRYWKSRYNYEVFINEDGNPDFKCVVNESASPDNIYSSIFIPWFVFEKYKKAPEGKFVPTKDEEDLIKLHGIKHEHLAWRRWAIENKCNGIEETFKQEYPSTAREAFLATGNIVFNVKKLELLKRFAPKPKTRYEIQLTMGHFFATPEGRLKVWEEPKPKFHYIIGADVAEGLAQGDFSCAHVIERLSGRQVAEWHGHIDADLFGHVLYWLAVRYNKALLAPERNNHGLISITQLQKMRYSNLYVELRKEPPFQTRNRFGWLTGTSKGQGKYAMIDNLVGELRDDMHGILCAELFDEMMTFKQTEEGELEAESGMFDDRVMACAIAKMVRKLRPLPNVSEEPKNLFSTGESAPPKMPTKGWN